MKSILVASDLSARSDRAIRRAARLARQHNAALTVLTVVDDDLPPAAATAFEATARETLNDLVTSLDATDAVTMVQLGDPVETIVATAEELDVDLLVMGTHKARPFWDMFAGTTMERVVRATARPVLLVKNPATGPYESVICGIDLSPSCVAAANMAARLAPEAHFTAFHAIHIPYQGFISAHHSVEGLAPFVDEAAKELDGWWKTAGISDKIAKPSVVPDSVTDVFETTSKAVSADLFALGAHGRPVFAPTLLGSFTEAQIRDPACDVLISRR